MVKKSIVGIILTGGAALPSGAVLGRIAEGVGRGGYRLSVATAVDGSQDPVAILVYAASAVAGDVSCCAYMSGEFNTDTLHYDASWTPSALGAALRPRGFFLRSVVSAAPPS